MGNIPGANESPNVVPHIRVPVDGECVSYPPSHYIAFRYKVSLMKYVLQLLQIFELYCNVFQRHQVAIPTSSSLFKHIEQQLKFENKEAFTTLLILLFVFTYLKIRDPEHCQSPLNANGFQNFIRIYLTILLQKMNCLINI